MFKYGFKNSIKLQSLLSMNDCADSDEMGNVIRKPLYKTYSFSSMSSNGFSVEVRVRTRRPSEAKVS